MNPKEMNLFLFGTDSSEVNGFSTPTHHFVIVTPSAFRLSSHGVHPYLCGVRESFPVTERRNSLGHSSFTDSRRTLEA